jgi:hypothetical protein
MSRSYREPYWTCGYGGSYRPWAKRWANKTVRRFVGEVQDGKWYRKLYESWEIRDYVIRWDPWPRIYSWGGEIRVVEPQPLWTVRCK